jgi:hypothetical protein
VVVLQSKPPAMFSRLTLRVSLPTTYWKVPFRASGTKMVRVRVTCSGSRYSS